MSTGAGPGAGNGSGRAGGHNLWLSVSGVFFFFFSGVLRVFPKKVPFLGSKKVPKPWFSNPGPNVHQSGSGGPILLVVGADGMKIVGR